MDNHFARPNQTKPVLSRDQKITKLSRVLHILDFIPIIALILSLIINIIISATFCQSKSGMCEVGLIIYGAAFLIPILAITQLARGLISVSVIKRFTNTPNPLDAAHATRAKANAIITTVISVMFIVFGISFLLLMLNWRIFRSDFLELFYNFLAGLAWGCAGVALLTILCSPFFAKIIQNYCDPLKNSHTWRGLSFISAVAIPVLISLSGTTWLITNAARSAEDRSQYEDEDEYEEEYYDEEDLD